MITLQVFRQRGLALFTFATLISTASPLRVQAQEPVAPPAAQPATSAPDVVRLKNGGIVRGTISELVPGDKVIIVTLTGEARTYPMSDVEYAGSASAEAPAPAAAPSTIPDPATTAAPAATSTEEKRPFITVHSGEARLRLEAAQEDTTFHVRVGTATASGGGYTVSADAYSEICTAPCEASLPNGTHVFALSHDGGSPVPAEPIRVEGSTTLTGKYKDRSGVRIGGWIIFLGGASVGTALMLTSIDAESGIGGGFYAGTAIFGVGMLVGLIMGMTGDGAEIERGSAPAPSASLRPARAF